jgi:hypothetical protein
VRVHAIGEYYQAAERDFAQALREQGFSAGEIGTHAGAADTSLSLAIDEQLVRSARLQDGSALGSAEGVSGDPRRASAAAGRAGIDLIVARNARCDPARGGASVRACRRAARAPRCECEDLFPELAT